MVSSLHRHYRPVKVSRERYANPYFRARRADRIASSRVKNAAAKISPRLWLWIIGSCIVLAALAWLLVFSDVFKITRVDISGLPDDENVQAESLVWEQADLSRLLLLSQSRLFVFSEKNLRETLEEQYAISSVKIIKKLPGTLAIRIIEKTPAAVWSEADSYYLIDAQGTIIRLVSGAVEGLPTLYNNGEARVQEHSVSGDLSPVGVAAEIDHQLKSRFGLLAYQQLNVDNDRNTIKAVLKNGGILLLATNEPLAPQFDRLELLLGGQLKDKVKTIHYIDLRFGDRVYYK